MFENYSWLIIFIALVVWYLSHQAGRLDRLHHRIEVANAALDGHLSRRAGVVSELVSLDFLDPANQAYLMQLAHDVLAGADLPDAQRLADESELTQALMDTFEDLEEVEIFSQDAAIAQLIVELKAVGNRIQLARRFHTEAVQDCQVLRKQFVVRLFRLMGHANTPKTLDFNDQLPAGLDG